MPDVPIWIHDHLGLSPDIQARILQTLATTAIVWLIRVLVLRVALRSTSDRPGLQYRWRKVTTYVAFVTTIVISAFIWSRGLGGFATSIGIFSAGVAVALKDPILNMAGFVFIMWRRPFRIGDRVQVGEFAGDVIDIRIFQFTLLEIGNWVQADQATGRVIHVPNGKVFTDVQANYNQDFPYIWHEIPVLITFESDWQAAKSLLERVVSEQASAASTEAKRRFREAARKFLLLDENLGTSVYTTVRDSGVLLTMRYLCDPHERRASEQTIWERVLLEFAAAPNIALAYPTQRFYRIDEGTAKGRDRT